MVGGKCYLLLPRWALDKLIILAQWSAKVPEVGWIPNNRAANMDVGLSVEDNK